MTEHCTLCEIEYPTWQAPRGMLYCENCDTHYCLKHSEPLADTYSCVECESALTNLIGDH